MHRLTDFSLRRPGLTLAILLVITLVLGIGATRVEQAYGFRVLVGDDHPAIEALDSLVEEFAGGYPARIWWTAGARQAAPSTTGPPDSHVITPIGRPLHRRGPHRSPHPGPPHRGPHPGMGRALCPRAARTSLCFPLAPAHVAGLVAARRANNRLRNR